MPAPKAASEKSERARHIFAAMMDGRSLREIAESEGLGVRRIQQIVAEELAPTAASEAKHAALDLCRAQ